MRSKKKSDFNSSQLENEFSKLRQRNVEIIKENAQLRQSVASYQKEVLVLKQENMALKLQTRQLIQSVHVMFTTAEVTLVNSAKQAILNMATQFNKSLMGGVNDDSEPSTPVRKPTVNETPKSRQAIVNPMVCGQVIQNPRINLQRVTLTSIRKEPVENDCSDTEDNKEDENEDEEIENAREEQNEEDIENEEEDDNDKEDESKSEGEEEEEDNLSSINENEEDLSSSKENEEVNEEDEDTVKENSNYPNHLSTMLEGDNENESALDYLHRSKSLSATLRHMDISQPRVILSPLKNINELTKSTTKLITIRKRSKQTSSTPEKSPYLNNTSLNDSRRRTDNFDLMTPNISPSVTSTPVTAKKGKKKTKSLDAAKVESSPISNVVSRRGKDWSKKSQEPKTKNSKENSPLKKKKNKTPVKKKAMLDKSNEWNKTILSEKNESPFSKDTPANRKSMHRKSFSPSNNQLNSSLNRSSFTYHSPRPTRSKRTASSVSYVEPSLRKKMRRS